MSDCYLHPGRDGVGGCVNCGKIVCVECKTFLGGKVYCQPCAEKLFATGVAGVDKAPPEVTATAVTPPEKSAATPPPATGKSGGKPWLIPAIIGGALFAVAVVVVIVVAFFILAPASREASIASTTPSPGSTQPPLIPTTGASFASPRGPTGTIATGDREELDTQSISSSGGVIVVNQPGNPLDGMEIVVPPGSYADSMSFTVATEPIISHTFGDDFNPLTPMIIIENGGEYSDELMTVTIPVQVPDDHFAMGFFYHEDNGKLEGMLLVEVDSDVITVATRHFSRFTLSGIAKSKLESYIKADIDSHFRPGIDDWQFSNYGSAFAPGGHCSGQALSSMWYFCEQPDGKDLTLHGRYDNNFNDWRTPDFWQDDSLAYRLCSVVHKDVPSTAVHFWLNLGGSKAILDTINNKWNFIKCPGINDSITRYLFAYSIQMTGEPQEIGVVSGDTGHAMVVYRIYKNSLYIADPNYPGNTERRIAYANGKFDAYESGANKAEIDAGYSTRYDHIHYLAKTSIVPWDTISKRWQEFKEGTIGNGLFPPYEMFYVDEDNNQYPLVDGTILKENKIYIACSFPHGGVYKTSVYKDEVYIPHNAQDKRNAASCRLLTPGTNRLGILIEKEWDASTEATKPFRYVNFKYITVICGEEQKQATESMLKCEADYSKLNKSVGGVMEYYYDDAYSKQGLWTRYWDSTRTMPMQQCCYVNNEVIYCLGYYEDGKLEYENTCAYIDGKQHSHKKEWYNSGGIRQETDFVDGISHGKSIYWYENGNKMEERTVVKGAWQGYAVLYHENGNIKSEGNYQNNEETGVWKYYKKDGTCDYRIDYNVSKTKKLPCN